VLLAMLSHSLGQVGLIAPEWINLVMRVATPMFIVIFGCMITLVHIPRYERLPFGEFTVICWARAGECYLWFSLNVLVMFLLGNQSLLYTFRSAIFLGSTTYVQILAFYTIYFMALPWIILGIRKFGLGIALFAAILVHIAFVPLKHLQIPIQTKGFEYIQRLIDLFFGAGTINVISGPSILHSFALLFGGVWIGRLLLATGRNAKDYASLAFPIALFLCLAAWSMTQNSIIPVNGMTLSDLGLRNLNHPAYIMIYGTLAFTMIIGLTLVLRHVSVKRELLVLGQRSLFVFGFGNVIVSCWKTTYQTGLYRSLSAIALMSTVVAAAYAYDVLLTHVFVSKFMNRLANAVRRVADGLKVFARMAAARLVELCLSQSTRQS
jgi:hypothetical protein